MFSSSSDTVSTHIFQYLYTGFMYMLELFPSILFYPLCWIGIFTSPGVDTR